MRDNYIDYWNAALDHSGRQDMTPAEARNYCEKTGIEPYLCTCPNKPCNCELAGAFKHGAPRG